MKKAFSIMVMISLLFQCMIQLGVVGWYQLNKKYVSEVLCENRSKPQMKCNGKCYLKKQLKKTSEQQKGQGTKTEQQELLSFILPQILLAPCAEFNLIYLQHHALYRVATYTTIATDIFHPPPVV